MYEYVVDGLTALMEEKEAVGTLVNTKPITEWGNSQNYFEQRMNTANVPKENNSKLNIEITSSARGKLDNKYTSLFKAIANELVEYSMKVDNGVLIENIVLDIDKTVPGDYSPNTKEVRVVGEDMREVLDTLVANGTIKELVGISSEAKLIRMLEESKAPRDALPKITESLQYKEYVAKAVKGKEKELKDAVFALDMNNVVVHELVHAATYAFINKENKNTQEKKIMARLELLFAEAKKRTSTPGYWRTDLHEFVAEAISNPEVIKMLEGMQISLGSRLTTFLRAIVDAMVAIVSTSKNKDNVYAYTLDGVMAIMEKGDGKERFTIPLRERRKDIKNTVNDILDNIKRCEG